MKSLTFSSIEVIPLNTEVPNLPINIYDSLLNSSLVWLKYVTFNPSKLLNICSPEREKASLSSSISTPINGLGKLLP